jgi:hypothetical protein
VLDQVLSLPSSRSFTATTGTGDSRSSRWLNLDLGVGRDRGGVQRCEAQVDDDEIRAQEVGLGDTGLQSGDAFGTVGDGYQY